MAGRIVRSVDFERVLRHGSSCRSVHFALHHLADNPSLPKRADANSAPVKLSTADAQVLHKPVDDLTRPALMCSEPVDAPDDLWLGIVVPKRYAKRATTRTLIKRQIRAAFERHGRGLAHGLWVARLRTPYALAQFPSAASEALRRSVADELALLLTRAARNGKAFGVPCHEAV